MQAPQLGVCVGGRHPSSPLLSNTSTLLDPFLLHRNVPTSLHLHYTHVQVSATLQGNVTENIAGAKSVKVKFVLRRRCEFGQQFLVVGDAEFLGAWNPELALPMQWSEGHIWTTEVEILMGKCIEFKIILMDEKGVVEWQPGPNRVLQTTASDAPLVVLETWYEGEQAEGLSGSELEEAFNNQHVFDNATTKEGGEQRSILLVDCDSVCEDMEATVDRLQSEENISVTEKQTASESSDDSNVTRVLSVFEKDVQWSRKALSRLWDTFKKK